MSPLFKKDKEPKTVRCPLCEQDFEDSKVVKSEHVGSHIYETTNSAGQPAYAFKCERCGDSDLSWTSLVTTYGAVWMHTEQMHGMINTWNCEPPSDN